MLRPTFYRQTAWETDRRWRAQQPGHLRHTDESAESCCLPALTRFTVARCAEPGYCARQRQQVQR